MPFPVHRELTAAEKLGLGLSRLLTVVAGISFGLGAGAIGVYLALSLILPAPGRDNWAAGPAWLLMMAIGGVIGLIAGGIGAGTIAFREPVRVWRPFDWLGLILGGAVSYPASLLVDDRYYIFFRILILAMVIPACATIGKLIGGDGIGPAILSREKRK